MRRSFYHTDLGQNAVVLSFEIQIALIYIQDDRSTRGRSAKQLKKKFESQLKTSQDDTKLCQLQLSK